ncbi:exonuclease 3'-5' domain-containing protein 2-like [Ptychodera flava]|uniref:exonuclease 3'-5' domain-containing protein 2-like n=1 Tax=Ptychodera flava TaxID=63121 RepID=UPI00396A1F11
MTFWTRLLIPITMSTVVALVTWFIVSNRRRQHSEDDDGSTNQKSPQDDKVLSKSYNVHQVLQKSIEIVVVESKAPTERMIELIINAIYSSGIKVIGLDCEWVAQNGQPNAVSLLQLSCLDYCCLIRLHKIKDSIPESLRVLLEDKSVLKVGVGVMEDSKKLHRDYGFNVKGCIDLRTVTFRHRPALKRTTNGSLADLSFAILSKQLDKDSRLRCGDWERVELSQRQVYYAAEDAISSLKIFLVVTVDKLNLTLAQLGKDRNWIRAMSMCQGIIDEKFKAKKGGPKNTRKNPGKVTPKYTEMDVNSKAYSARKGPLYHNCQLQAPDGQLLCTCDRKKAEWYLAKGIGSVVSEEPLVVRLKFEPAGRPGSERNYYLKEKENQCVVCGANKSYIRKNIVPHEYRKHFPANLKEHSSHDVVLLCFTCHQHSSAYDSTMRKKMADKYDAPLPNQENSRFHDDPIKVKVRSAARALKFNKHKLPDERLAELVKTVQDFLSVDTLTDELIEECITLDAKISNDDYISHGEQVVRLVSQSNGGLLEFEKQWRRHFVNTMEPKFLPELWSINHRDTDAEEYSKRKHGVDGLTHRTSDS